MQYFIDHITTYSNVNNKGRELQAFIEPFAQHLIPNELSLDGLKAEIRDEIERLNKAYPKTKPLILSVYRGTDYMRWEARVEDNCDKVVFILSLKKILGTFRYIQYLKQLNKKTNEQQ